MSTARWAEMDLQHEVGALSDDNLTLQLRWLLTAQELDLLADMMRPRLDLLIAEAKRRYLEADYLHG